MYKERLEQYFARASKSAYQGMNTKDVRCCGEFPCKSLRFWKACVVIVANMEDKNGIQLRRKRLTKTAHKCFRVIAGIHREDDVHHNWQWWIRRLLVNHNFVA